MATYIIPSFPMKDIPQGRTLKVSSFSSASSAMQVVLGDFSNRDVPSNNGRKTREITIAYIGLGMGGFLDSPGQKLKR